MEINIDAEYLRSRRTLTAAQVAENARERARFDLSPGERLDNASHHAEPMAARH